MSLCKDCIRGVRHEGTAEGKWEVLGDIRTYVATPEIEYPKDKVLLYLTDVFGAEFLNNQLLADDFARNGFKVIMPDLFNRDPIPESAFDPSSGFSIPEWLLKHGTEQTRSIIDKVIAALKEQGVKDIGATGYCYGARGVFDLAFDGQIKASVVSHPSLLKNPDDLESYSKTNIPLLINSCTIDQQFPKEFQDKADEILGGGKFAPGYEQKLWEGCTHGFMVRGDPNDPKSKAGKEGGFKASVEFLIKYL